MVTAPDGSTPTPVQQESAAAAISTTATATAAGDDLFAELRQHPQFTALRAMVQQNPNLIQPVCVCVCVCVPLCMCVPHAVVGVSTASAAKSPNCTID